MACLLVCKLPALGAVTLAESAEMRREWHTPFFFSLLLSSPFFILYVLYFLMLSAPPPSSCCLPHISLSLPRLSSPFFSSPHKYCLFSSAHLPPILLLTFLHYLPSSFAFVSTSFLFSSTPTFQSFPFSPLPFLPH